MNNVVDEVLAGSPKYTLTYNDNTTATGVSIDLETAVTTQGTPLNKALFDSIRDDLNTRLLISSKATTSQAQGGSNDTNYMTPSKVKTQLQYLTKTGSFNHTSTTSQTYTILDPANIPSGVKRVILTGTLAHGAGSSYISSLTVNGTRGTLVNIPCGYLYSGGYGTSSDLSFTYKYSSSGTPTPYGFRFDIDLNTKTITFNVNLYNGSEDIRVGSATYTTLTSVTALLRAGNSTATTVNYTTTYIY